MTVPELKLLNLHKDVLNLSLFKARVYAYAAVCRTGFDILFVCFTSLPVQAICSLEFFFVFYSLSLSFMFKESNNAILVIKALKQSISKFGNCLS